MIRFISCVIYITFVMRVTCATYNNYVSRALDKFATTDLGDDYSLGSYYNVHILITSGMYVNIDQLSKSIPDSCKKPYSEWYNAASSGQLCTFILERVQQVESVRGVFKLIVSVADNPLFSGIYIHHYLLPTIAQWMSPSVTLRFANIITQHAIDQPNSGRDDSVGPLGSIVTTRYNKFAIGMYCGIRVRILDDQYINVDKLRNEVIVTTKTDGRYGNWARLASSKNYIDHIHQYIASVGHDPIQLNLKISNANSEFNGTYAHYLLIPPILQWMSFHVNLMMVNIINMQN